MGQSVHVEIEILATEDLKGRLRYHTILGRWCWIMSYVPTEEESYGFNDLLTTALRPLPSTVTKEVEKKIRSWKHQETFWWCYLEDFLVMLDDPDLIPREVRRWYLRWGSAHLGLLGKPRHLRIIVWVAEGSYD